jgi:hypothetical protein
MHGGPTSILVFKQLLFLLLMLTLHAFKLCKLLVLSTQIAGRRRAAVGAHQLDVFHMYCVFFQSSDVLLRLFSCRTKNIEAL